MEEKIKGISTSKLARMLTDLEIPIDELCSYANYFLRWEKWHLILLTELGRMLYEEEIDRAIRWIYASRGSL